MYRSKTPTMMISTAEDSLMFESNAVELRLKTKSAGSIFKNKRAREDPEQCQQYKDYDDLEKHFDECHFLCEAGDCCAKKFIVFSSECKLKKHDKKRSWRSHVTDYN
ncbi:hypothetical protein HYC85_013008 [Camellia sinensis]|uniref:ZNF598/HEL2 C2H2 zinc finger domain-containing protein n=1 Tax=Camellia sinensis TaxID=4442 RepID=A0A7J7HEE4_CAMSI|nr:hypothetical protein HYC85_013008 [Camellia sinensis]